MTISADQLPSVEKIDIQIEEYQSNLDQNIAEIEKIEELIIKRLASMINLPPDSYSVYSHKDPV